MLIVQPFHSGLCCHEHGSSVPKHEILHWGQLMPPVPAGDAWLEGRAKQITRLFLMALSAWLGWNSSHSTYRWDNCDFPIYIYRERLVIPGFNLRLLVLLFPKRVPFSQKYVRVTFTLFNHRKWWWLLLLGSLPSSPSPRLPLSYHWLLPCLSYPDSFPGVSHESWNSFTFVFLQNYVQVPSTKRMIRLSCKVPDTSVMKTWNPLLTTVKNFINNGGLE